MLNIVKKSTTKTLFTMQTAGNRRYEAAASSQSLRKSCVVRLNSAGSARASPVCYNIVRCSPKTYFRLNKSISSFSTWIIIRVAITIIAVCCFCWNSWNLENLGPEESYVKATRREYKLKKVRAQCNKKSSAWPSRVLHIDEWFSEVIRKVTTAANCRISFAARTKTKLFRVCVCDVRIYQIRYYLVRQHLRITW